MSIKATLGGAKELQATLGEDEVMTAEMGSEGFIAKDGGFYTPSVSNVDEDTIMFSFAASEEGMPAVPEVEVPLPKGPQGEQGPKGDKGDTGSVGPKGDTGEKGEPGPAGADGAKGDKGDKGDQGEPGAKGDKGDTGATGPQGPAGADGQPGKDGSDGKDGSPGKDGEPGERGTGILNTTTGIASYTTAVGGVSPQYRILLSTLKTQSKVNEVLVGDAVRYSYYLYPIIYVDAEYAYMTTRVSIRGATGAAGAAGSDATVTTENIEAALGYTPMNPGEYAVSVKVLGAKGDGSTDDTAIFQSALANNRKVYVPGGTYKLSGELVIGDNCQLELAQDAVLNFTQTSGNCITISRVSWLKGNHATIFVPYLFRGRCINVDTSIHYSTDEVPPWIHSSPMWKHGRYVTDINICMATSQGAHVSLDGSYNGTAVYICANRQGTGKDVSPFIWGLNFSGLRIAGPFEYGIYAENYDNNTWNHEMRIEAFMQACCIGVCLDNCHKAFISAVIQPHAAYDSGNYNIKYAKNGIRLINSVDTDLTGSRVWDWNDKETLWTYDKDNPNQHIALYGNCRGTILNDYRYFNLPAGFNDIRELIYTDTPSNYDSLIILQEPITKWYKPIDNLPYFNNGIDGDQRLCLKSEQDALFQTRPVARFTNQLPLATDSNGAVYEGKGYASGYLTSPVATDPPVRVESPYFVHTGFIPCKENSVIRFSGMKWYSSTGYDRIFTFSDYNTPLQQQHSENVMSNGAYFFGYEETEDGFIITLKQVLKDVKYFRITLRTGDIGTNPIIAVDEELVYDQVGFLSDGINMSYENVFGLEEHYVGINRRVLEVTEAATDDQYPTAKAVYDAIQNSLGVIENGTY